MSIHLALADRVAREFGERLATPVDSRPDALILRLVNGVTLTVRYAATDAYSLRWAWSDREAGIDTAPLHPGLATFPRHLHTCDGRVVADPLTHIDASPEDNLTRVLNAVLEDPHLGYGESG